MVMVFCFSRSVSCFSSERTGFLLFCSCGSSVFCFAWKWLCYQNVVLPSLGDDLPTCDDGSAPILS